FLASTLISLLMVYLLSKRFGQPLDRLTRGLEKTAGGELYYMMQVDGDSEFRRLVRAFNRMTQTLWDNQKELKSYNARLYRSNASIIESQLFLATLIDSSPLAILVTNSRGKIVLFNRAASTMFGYDADRVIGESGERLFAEQPQYREAQSVGGDAIGGEAICRRADGKSFPTYVVRSRVVGATGALNADLLIIRDISESRRFQDMMVRLDRYYTRGEMAGDIAHEINNYLAVLMGNLELLPLLLKRGDTEKIDSKLDIMKTTVDRIARFANGLMDTPHEDTRLESTSMNQIVENIIAFLKPQNKFDSIKISADLSGDVTMVDLDPGQIQQLLVNLVYNASEALKGQEGSKEIEVGTLLVQDNEKWFVQVEVRDNGPGVPVDKVETMFNERFTTKRKGHGIGLITCRKIAQNHGGSIHYRFDGGAVFYFRLPARPPLAQGDTDKIMIISDQVPSN
ncbi:PAS domain S-box protein, partial [candidate division GN15 bacterium]|nr:PAS domain S-box protein [candidate division GN15 bacterium]